LSTALELLKFTFVIVGYAIFMQKLIGNGGRPQLADIVFELLRQGVCRGISPGENWQEFPICGKPLFFCSKYHQIISSWDSVVSISFKELSKLTGVME
jgi:hypothetical protein